MSGHDLSAKDQGATAGMDRVDPSQQGSFFRSFAERSWLSRTLLWPIFFGGILLAWLALWLMAQELGSPSAYGPGFWAALCRAGAADLAYLPLVAMWAVMVAAMMAPTFAPALGTFLDLPPPAGDTPQALALIAGYLAIWLATAFGLAALQITLARSGLVAPNGQSLSDGLTAGLFALAGLYQFTALKAACLTRCRAPLTVFMAHWRPGMMPAATMGARIGIDCMGCCWALMLLAFVGGMGNLLFMGLATLIMVLEKLPDIGRPLTRPLGLALILSGGAFALRAIGG